jgi:hypothetical protein
VVSVLTTEPIVHGFKPGQGRLIFKGDETRNSNSFGRGSESHQPHVVRFYGILKIPADYYRDT